MQKSGKKIKTWLLLTFLIVTNSFINSSLFSKPLNEISGRVSVRPLGPFKPLIYDLKDRFPKHSKNPLIIISTSEQRLYLIENLRVTESHIISTAEAGTGNQSGSNKTPLGVHSVTEKFGHNAPAGTIFKARKNTKRIAEIITKPGVRSKADNVTSRILWLTGMEPGINKGGKVDSHSRYIYIHGTDEEGRLGKPASHGCIRMSNKAVIELFNRVPKGTLVDIVE